MAKVAQVTDQGFEFISFQVIENVPTHNNVEASIVSVGQQVVENCLVSESILRGEIIKGAESMIKIFYIDRAGKLREKIDIGSQGRPQVPNMAFFLVPKLIIKDVKC
jgi:ADP-glucose pyrophosphorylase